MSPRRREPWLAVACAVLLVAAAGSASGGISSTAAGARGFAVEVLVPGQDPVFAASVAAPRDAAALGQAFAYPDDGSIVQTAGITASAQADTARSAAASASADVNGLSLFGGEVTATLVAARATALAGPLAATGNAGGSGVSGLAVLGQPLSLAPQAEVPLGDWGTLTMLEETGQSGGAFDQPSYRGTVAALHVRLAAAHGGLPAGSEIVIGYSEASAGSGAVPSVLPPTLAPPAVRLARPQAARPAATATASATATPAAKAKAHRAPEPERTGPVLPSSLVRRPPTGLHPNLTAGRYVFPVYGEVGYSDTFGAPRADASYHHGDDLFAPLGTPILAVADGTVYTVGWNDVGGNRLWLQDGQGNQFYYAHLSAFSPSAREGARVTAGTVVGFVGNTGDAEGTPYHLHFEVHPVSLLYLGYDGAVDPTPYLVGWQHLRDVSFTAARGWVPPAASSSPAPKPGAILLGVSDISGASGLDPGSLQRAIVAPVSAEGDGSLVRGAALGGG